MFSLLLALTVGVKAQYFIEGHIEDTKGIENQYAYLSVIDGWNDFHKIEEQYIIQSRKVDSTGSFQFEGHEFSKRKSFYRIHFAPQHNPTLVIGYPRNYFYFISNNQDSISLRLNSTSFAAVSTIHSPISENSDLLDLCAKIDSFRKMEFSASMTNQHKDSIGPNLQSSFEPGNTNIRDNRLALIKAKKQNYLVRYIEENKNPLLQLYALYSGNFDFNRNQPLYNMVSSSLKQGSVDKKYGLTLDEYMAAHSYKTTSIENSFLRIVLGLSIFLNLIFLTIFLIRKRQNNLTKSKTKRHLPSLTSKEVQIVNLICNHKTNKEIATLLAISSATVKTHINNIYRKLDINSRQELIATSI